MKRMLMLAIAVAVLFAAVNVDAEGEHWKMELVGGMEAAHPSAPLKYTFHLRTDGTPAPEDWRWVAERVFGLPGVFFVEVAIKRCTGGICGTVTVQPQ